MASFAPKNYQTQVLSSVEIYFKKCHELPSASVAFNATTEYLWGRSQPYNLLQGFGADMPYFCLRVPTGGGKTWMAAKSVALVNTHFLRCEHSVILWLVPSRTIREQTLRALKDHQHPYHTALREAGPVTVMDLEDAKSVTRATLDTSSVIIVATRQAFQVEDEECRKVYQSSGALMHHFDNLAPAQRAELLKEGEGADQTTPYSLVNVLRLRRPFVIVDEAHNSRSELAFDMLARFRPSGVMELTATPDMERTPSNVLHSVSAAELKSEQMIKLPVVLETEPNWQQCLADAIGRRDALHQLADVERRAGAAYLRPIVLIQAEPRRSGIETLDVERVRNELVTNHRIPAGEIVVVTSEEKGLEKIDAGYPKPLRDKEIWDAKLNTLTINTPLSEDETATLAACVTSVAAVAAIVAGTIESSTSAIEFFHTPAELGERFRVPQLALRVQGELRLFDDPGVRNLVRREGSSFFLQKADGRFYPDFVCQLPGKGDQPGPVLIVEYKGADRWKEAEDDRKSAGLWADLSGGRWRFVMVKDKRWDMIEASLD